MITMLVLRNIRRTAEFIEADFYIEGEEPKGHVKISLPDGEYLEVIPSPKYTHSTAPSHAKYELQRLAKRETLPEEKKVFWY